MIILAALGVFVLAEVALFLFGGSESVPTGLLPVRNGQKIPPAEEMPLPEFISEVPKNIEETPAEISEEIKEGVGAGTGLHVFNVIASKNGYDPAVIVVTEGDTVRLQLTSQGKKFDLFSPYMGFYLEADEGATEQLSFIVPVSGTFLFKCRNFCPNGKTIQGQLIVKPKEQ